MPAVFDSLIQGDFGDRDHGNFEAVIREGNSLVHWFRDNTAPGLPWIRAQVIAPTGVVGAGSIIQSDFGTGDHGNFEVVVPVEVAAGRVELWHYWHDNSDVSIPWQQGNNPVARDVAGPASLIQSDFGSGDHGNFELVVPIRAAAGVELWHFWHDNSDVGSPWRPGNNPVARDVGGPGCLIQSDFGDEDNGNFEVVVQLDEGELAHFWHDNSDIGSPWQPGNNPVALGVSGPGCLIQSDFGSGDHGNFEVVAPLDHGALFHFWHDNSDVGSPWRWGQVITSAAAGWAALTRSNYGLDENDHGNFEILAEELTRSVVSYWHPNRDVSLPWLRHWVLIGEPYPRRRLESTRKIVQLTGEHDLEGWPGSGPRSFAFNRTESQPARIRGCDLGASFSHGERIVFLFGDTWRVHTSDDNVNLDSLAWTTDRDPSRGIHLEFHGRPPIVQPAIPQREFNVPLDGTSHAGKMFVFFSTDHRNIDGADQMGRSVLTRCDDEPGNVFTLLGTFSNRHFINVSVEQGSLDPEIARTLEWESGTPVLWIWGSGRYRGSDVRLAVVRLEDLAELRDVRFLVNRRNQPPLWSDQEADAIPVFVDGSVGELSVRWNPQLQRYLALFNSNNPWGILMHSSPTPWGPWTQRPVMVFDPRFSMTDTDPGDGLGRFMHRSWAEIPNPIDHVQDTLISGDRNNENGDAYGPYQIVPYSTGEIGNFTQLFFSMSTWNPYQSVLMTTKIGLQDLAE